jgi:ATP-dependent helicase/nuclease subunit A
MNTGLTINGLEVDEARFYGAALDPSRSIVVQACAGSGKTWMLAARVLRLLLAGVEPSSIVAITFTNKAAAEMQSRIQAWLELLATVDDDQLENLLAQIRVPGTELSQARIQARSLFAQVLTAGDAIGVHTFHGWFLRLRSALPLSMAQEAFATLSAAPALLHADAWRRFLDDIARQPKLQNRYAQFVAKLGLTTSAKALRGFLGRRSEWLCYTAGQADPAGWATNELMTLHADVLGFTPDDFLRAQRETITQLARDFGRMGGAKAQAAAGEIIAVLHAGFTAEAATTEFERILLTLAGGPRVSLITKAMTSEPDVVVTFERLAALLQVLRERRVALELIELHRDWYALGHALVCAYEAEKTERGEIDFADLELHMARILADPSAAPALQSRLDIQVKHLLIDEFQDTNPLQWQIVRHWLESYGPQDQRPSVFLVGDPKQSIYRFRRADPAIFPAAAEFLVDHFEALQLATQRTRRNAAAVNAFVNALFKAPAGPWGSTMQGTGPFGMQVTLSETPGLVEVFEQIEVPESSVNPLSRDPLSTPVEVDGAGAGHAEGAAIATRLLALRDAAALQGQVWNWGEVLLLSTTRAAIRDIESGLRAAGVPYESSRRGGLLDAPEIRDIQALATVLATPSADLALAQVLRSPLFDFDDADLISLWPKAEPRGWHALPASNDPRHRAAHGRLQHWRDLAGHLPVHDVLDHIYGSHDLLGRYAAAMPAARRDSAVGNLQRLLELALDTHGGRYPSLARFVGALEEFARIEPEDAPDEAMPDARESVLVTTVHSAKGLERDIVVLFDTHRLPQGGHRGPEVLVDWPPAAPRPSHFSCQFPGLDTQARKPLKDQEQARALVEQGALLYVATTRARRQLIISGRSKRKAMDASWWSVCQAIAPAQAWPAAQGVANEAPDQAEMARFVASVPWSERESTGDAATSARAGAGSALHGLLEHASVLAAAQRELAKPVLLERIARQQGLPLANVAALWPEMQAILQAPLLEPFFATGVRAANESSLVSADGQLLRIDRLVWIGDTLWVLDFKRMATSDPDRDYGLQLQGYMQALQQIEPAARIRAAVITQAALLYEWRADAGRFERLSQLHS